MKKIDTLFDALKAASGKDFSTMLPGQWYFRNVAAMLYPQKETLRKLFTYKGLCFITVIPLGFEPRTPTLKV